MLGLAGWVHKEYDRRFQALDLVEVHNADSRTFVGPCRHAVVFFFLIDNLPEVICQVGRRPQPGLLLAQQLNSLGHTACRGRSSPGHSREHRKSEVRHNLLDGSDRRNLGEPTGRTS